MANTRQKTPAPVTVLGPTNTQRPLATSLPLGSKFVNETTGEEYTVVRAGGAAAGAHSWIQTGSGEALPVNYKFSGGLTGAAGAVTTFLADDVAPAGSATAIRYPVPAAGTIRGLEVYVDSNTLATACNATVFVNGLATAITIAIGAGLTGAFSSATTLVVADTDTVDVRLDNTAGVALNEIHLSATLHIS